jgi:hypothetical protein
MRGLDLSEDSASPALRHFDFSVTRAYFSDSLWLNIWPIKTKSGGCFRDWLWVESD